MRAIVLPEYNGNIVRAMRGLEVKEIDMPSPKENQVLIKIEAAPCNPSDIAFMRGMYNIVKDVPVVMGFEGTGTVVKTGSESNALALLGKRVSCFTQENVNGTWAEYFVTDAANCIEVRDEIDNDQAACLFVNPFTGWSMMELAAKKGASAIVQNAASGQIGSFLCALAKRRGIKMINIVRKPEHVEMLIARGEEYVLCSQHETFQVQLDEICKKLNATIAFDAAGGEVTGTMFNALCAGGKVILYGGLSGRDISGVNVMDLIFKKKKITGYNVNDWLSESDPAGFQRAVADIQELVLSGELKSSIQGSYRFEEVIDGLRQYISNMSGGKILFRP